MCNKQTAFESNCEARTFRVLFALETALDDPLGMLSGRLVHQARCFPRGDDSLHFVGDVVHHTPYLVTTNPIGAHIRYGPWLVRHSIIALNPPLHSVLIWTLAGLVLAHGPDPTIAFVSDTEALPGLDQASFIMHICSAMMDMGPGPTAQGPKAAGLQGCQGPYRIRMQWRYDLSSRM